MNRSSDEPPGDRNPSKEPEDLIGFREALLVQHKKRCLALKRSVDEDLADIISARRIEVEGIVHGLRRSREKRLEEGLEANLRYSRHQKKVYEGELQDVFFEALEKEVRSRLKTFRRSPRYGAALAALAAEAQQNFAFPWVALVEKGDAPFLPLSPRGNIQEVREELGDVWGGVVLVAAGGCGRIVDNTFRTRWRRLCLSSVFKVDLRGGLRDDL
ncbi:MAG: hypothetical protein LBO68_01205 [Synergistaceae bacterium]|jgi:hypothetical protein|nr:hypothetical protein [Synergistaceae bacterium]